MARRIRSDLAGALSAHQRDRFGRAILSRPVTLHAGDVVPDGVLVSERHLDPEGASVEGGKQEDPPAGQQVSDGDPTLPTEDQLDDMTVPEIVGLLDGLPPEQGRVLLGMEQRRRARKGVLRSHEAEQLGR